MKNQDRKCKTNFWLGYPNSSINSSSAKPNFLYKALGAAPFGSFSRNVETVISLFRSNSFTAFSKRSEPIPRFLYRGETAKQQIILRPLEKSITPMIFSLSLIHNACFLFIKRKTVSLCSSIFSCVSNPGKFQLTSFTKSIHKSISDGIPYTAVIKIFLQIFTCKNSILNSFPARLPFPVGHEAGQLCVLSALFLLFFQLVHNAQSDKRSPCDRKVHKPCYTVKTGYAKQHSRYHH